MPQKLNAIDTFFLCRWFCKPLDNA